MSAAWKDELKEAYAKGSSADHTRFRGKLGADLTNRQTKCMKLLEDATKARVLPQASEFQSQLNKLHFAADRLHYFCNLVVNGLSDEEEQAVRERHEGYFAAYEGEYRNLATSMQNVLDTFERVRENSLPRRLATTEASTATLAMTTLLSSLTTTTTATSTRPSLLHLGDMSSSRFPSDRWGLGDDISEEEEEARVDPLPGPWGNGLMDFPALQRPGRGRESRLEQLGNRQTASRVFGSGQEFANNLREYANNRDQRTDAREAENMMSMFSRSLASSFLITNIIPKKFDGNTEDYPQFELLWTKADNHMDALQFAPAAKFWELKKVVTGAALAYLQGLPPNEDTSYQIALTTLKDLYSQNQSKLKNLVRTLMALPVGTSSFADRQKLHSTIVAYKQAVVASGADPAQALLAIEFTIIEARLDDQWKKDWFRFCAKRRDPASPLGFDVKFIDLVQVLHRSMIEQQRMRNAAEFAPAKARRGGGSQSEHKQANEAQPVLAAVAGSHKRTDKEKARGVPFIKAKRPERERKRSDKPVEIVVKCPFCKNDKGQEFTHAYPLTCPKLRRSLIEPDKIREIASKQQLCQNCFAPHKTSACDAPTFVYCRVDSCGKRHSKFFHNQEGGRSEKAPSRGKSD